MNVLIDLINKLSQLSDKSIKSFSLEEATLCFEHFDFLKKSTAKIWKIFKSFDIIDTRDERTLELLDNYASGRLIEQTKLFNRMLNQTLFNNSLKTNKDEDLLEKYKTMAEIYLDYKKQKALLDTNESKLVEHIKILNSNSTEQSCLLF